MMEEESLDLESEDLRKKRRVLRQRKILDNAKKRLEILRGYGNEETRATGICDSEYSDPEVEPDLPFARNSHLTGEHLIGLNNNFTNEDENASFSVMDSFFQETPPTPMKEEDTRMSSFIKSRSHILLAALMSYLLLLLQMESTSYIFLPVGLGVILELIYFKKDETNALMKMLFLFCGLEVRKANMVYKFVCTVYKLIEDLCVFVFTFCILTLIHNVHYSVKIN